MAVLARTSDKVEVEKQSEEGAAFLARLADLAFPAEASAQPRDDVEPAVAASLKNEEELRRIWAQARTSPDIKALAPRVGLVDVYGQGTTRHEGSIFKIRRRHVDSDASAKRPVDVSIPGGPRPNSTRSDAQHVLALPDWERRPHGAPAIATREEFKETFNIFTENAFALLTEQDWQGVLVAGGSVLTALTPLPKKCRKSRRELRRYLHENGPCRGSDVDVFLYDMADEEAAKEKMIRITQLIADAIPWDITCIRSKHAVTLVSQYPHRHIQFVLRLYSSPAEILIGFDVDSSAVGFDGQRVLAVPRALISLITQSNTVDMTRRSPSYEVRLSKYAERGFEIYVPNLRRADIDPSIYERTPLGIKGLALLLVLEKMRSQSDRDGFMDQRRKDRSRPDLSWQQKWSRSQFQLSGDLKNGTERGQWLAGLATSNYDSPSTAFHLPYGPRWQAARVEKLLYQTDVVLNAAWNEKNKPLLGLHRHPAFFGTIAECMEDCCKLCPRPATLEQKQVFDERCKDYVQGPLEFITQEPGKQLMSASFQPLTDADWTEQAYMTSAQIMMQAVLQGDVERIRELCSGDQETMTRTLLNRDQSGRTPLHLAILERKTDVALLLVSEIGARITSRLADGRSAFMLAAEHGNASLLRAMLARSKSNEAAASEQELRAASNKHDDTDQEDDADSEEDEASEGEEKDSEDDEAVLVKRPGAQSDKNAQEEGIPSEAETPDIVGLEDCAWDSGLRALHYAVTSGSAEAVKVLLDAEASPNIAAAGLHPLMAAVVIVQDEAAIAVLKVLVEAGSSCSRMVLHKSSHGQTNSTMLAFTSFVLAGRYRLVAALLELDAKRSAFAADFAVFQGRSWSDHAVTSALGLALLTGQLGVAALLLSAGAKAHINNADWEAARSCSLVRKDNRNYSEASMFGTAIQPLAASLLQANLGFHLLLAANPTLPISAMPHMVHLAASKKDGSTKQAEEPLTILQELNELTRGDEGKEPSLPEQTDGDGSSQNLYEFVLSSLRKKAQADTSKTEPRLAHREEVLEFAQEAHAALAQGGATAWPDLTFEPPLKSEVESRYLHGRRRLFFDATASNEKLVKTLSLERSSMSTSHIQFYALAAGSRYTMYYRAEPIARAKLDSCRKVFDAVVRGDREVVLSLTQTDISAAICFDVRDQRPNVKRTLLHVAVDCRQWAIAADILRISAKQYKKPEQKKASYSIGYDYDYSDQESDLDIVEDEPRKEADLLDEEAADSSAPAVESLTDPAEMLASVDWFDAVNTALEEDPASADSICDMIKTVMETADDEDPFLNTNDRGLAWGLELALLCDSSVLFMHYLMKRGYHFAQLGQLLRAQDLSQNESAGDGIASDDEDQGHEDPLIAGKGHFYPGLLVHGKRKSEWASRDRVGGVAAKTPDDVPRLLDLASKYQAHNCIRWLTEGAFVNVRALLLARMKVIEAKLDEPATDGDEHRDLGTEMRSLSKFDTHSEQHLALVVGATNDDKCQWRSPVLSAVSMIRPKKRSGTFELLYELFPSCITSWVKVSFREHAPSKYAPYSAVLMGFFRIKEAIHEKAVQFKKELQWLIEHGTDALATDTEGLNALHMLVKFGDIRIASQAFTALQEALGADIIPLLVAQSPLSGQRRGSTPLHELLSSKHLGPHKDEKGLLPSHPNSSGLAAQLLALPDAPIATALKTRDAGGCTPLALAIKNADAMGTRLLLRKCKSLGLLELLRWEDVVGDLPIEKLRRKLIQQSVNHETTSRKIPRWPELCDLRNGVLNWEGYRERLAARGDEALHRSLAGQIAELKFALDASPGMNGALSKACEEVIAKLERQLERFGEAEADRMDFDGVLGLEILRMVEQHTPGDCARVLIPAFEVQRATKNLLDQSDTRYNPPDEEGRG